VAPAERRAVKDSSFKKVYSLLRPELRPRLGALFGVLVLAAITAFGEKAPLLLLKPLWDQVLFPAAEEAPAAEGEAAVRLLPGTFAQRIEDLQAGLMASFERLQGAVGRACYPPAGPEDVDERRIAALLAVALVIAALTLVTAASQYALTWTSRRVALGMLIDLRQRIARHLMRLSMRYHGQRRFGDLLSRIGSDVSSTLSVVNTSLKDLTQQPLEIAGALAVAAIAAPQATAMAVVVLPLVALPIAVLGRRVRKRSRKSLTKLGASLETLTQMFRGIRTVKAFRAEERELERYRESNAAYMKASMRMVHAIATIQSATTLLSHMGFALLVVGVGWASIRLRWFTNGGDMLMFLAGISMIYTNVRRITNAVNGVQESAGAADRLQALLDEPVDVAEREGAVAIRSLGLGVRFEEVSFTYPGGERPAIDRLSLEIRPGETLALVGRSGAGKTTLVDLIARFVDPTEGRVSVGGHDLREVSLDSWPAMYALVGQVPFLFHASVAENIRYGRPGASQAEIEAAARAGNIHDFVLSLPKGYDTPVGDAGSRLSGGQRQRITIARAILKGAPLLLLDEATSALDSESEAEVQRALERLKEGRTVVVIAHRLSTIRNADRIAVLDEGRLVELGSHAELIARGGAYARLHAVQFPAGSEVAV